VAPWVGMAVPESRVAALPEDEEGAVHANAVEAILRLARGAQAVLIGPGMLDEAAVADLVEALVPELIGSTLVLDAAALPCVKANPSLFHPLEGRAALTPHAGEMASMLGISKEEVLRDPVATARDAAARWGAVVALKGAETCIAAPDGTAFLNRTGNVGLATSGSGDTLAGIVAGLAARGADPLHACVWGVYLHGRAGDCLAQRMGRLGFLARELLAEVPVIMAGLADPDADPCKERIPF